MKGKSWFPKLNDEDWLIQKYSVESLSSSKIASLLGCKSRVTVSNALKRFSIPPHSKGQQGEANVMFGIHLDGEKSSCWKGGKIKTTCLECGCVFSVTPSKLKAGFGKFCSHSCARKSQHMPKHHTKPEMIFEELCKKNNLPFKYTGDGSFWIGKNPSVNPDFVECNGKKIAVEIFSYWHNPLQRFGKVRHLSTYNGRKSILKEYGWKLVIFWQEDLEREDAEAFVLRTLQII